jgi:hypothetical protein
MYISYMGNVPLGKENPMRFSETGPRNTGTYMGNRVPLVKAFPGCTVIFKKNYHYVSGFVGFPSGKWVYFWSADDRWGENKYFARTAAHEKDYTGGRNHQTESQKKEELFTLITNLSTQVHKAT